MLNFKPIKFPVYNTLITKIFMIAPDIFHDPQTTFKHNVCTTTM